MISQQSWQDAVDELRHAASSPGQSDIFDWIEGDESVRWSQFKNTLTGDAFAGKTKPPLLACSGNPTDNLPALREAGFKVLALWHVTCKNIALKTQDRDQAGYWEERWELYRWMYLGGRFLASHDVTDIELYNEPNLDACLTSEIWLDEVRVRSVALQDAYADHSSWSQRSIKPTLIVPPMSAPVFEGGRGTPSYGRLAVQDVHTKFPSLENDPNWWNGVEYSYHQYNCTFSTFDAISTEVFTHSHTPTYAAPGYGMRSAWDKVSPQIISPCGRKLPIRVSEHNAYASATAEKYAGVDVMDSPKTAALLAGQVVAMADRAFFLSVNKFSQTYSSSSSGVVKNGLLWGDLGHNEGGRGSCDLGGITKSGEAYRLLNQYISGSKPILPTTISPSLPSTSNFTSLSVADSLAHNVIFSNAGSSTETVTLSLSKLSGASPGAPVVITGVSSSLHGEVQSTSFLSSSRAIKLSIPSDSLLVATIPTRKTTTRVLSAIQDSYVAAGSRSGEAVGGLSSILTVQTSTGDQENTKVAYLKFDLSGIERSKIVSAVLQVSQVHGGSSSGQVMTVVGTSDAWDEISISWNTAPGLLSSTSAVTSIAKNFINFSSARVVGHLTTSSAKTKLSLDVARYLRQGNDASFAIVRMFRHDARGSGRAALPADKLGGAVNFQSRESGNGPVLRVIYAP